MVNMVEIETAFMVKMGIMVEIIIKVEMVTLVNIIKKVNMVVIVIMVKMVIVDVVTVGRSKYGIKLPPYCPILLRILTFPDPHCRPSQIFVVQNGVYMCPAYSTTCFKFNQHLRGVF